MALSYLVSNIVDSEKVKSIRIERWNVASAVVEVLAIVSWTRSTIVRALE